MTAFEELNKALKALHENMSDVHVRAMSLDDLKPIEEKIRMTREWLKSQNAKLLLLKTQRDFCMSNNEAGHDSHDSSSLTTELRNATTNTLINNAAINLCLHSYGVRTILSEENKDSDLYKRMSTAMHKLFVINSSILDLQKETEKALQEQLTLKVQCWDLIVNYNDFVAEQQEKVRKHLDETDPAAAKYKERAKKRLKCINAVKKVIINLIGASTQMLLEHDFLMEMLEKHRHKLTIDRICRMSQSTTDREATREDSNSEEE